MCFGFASFESGVSSPNFQVYLSGGVPPSTSDLNSTVSGAAPSSGVPSAQARSGAGSSSPLPAAAVVVVGAFAAATVVGVVGASLGPPPPPQPGRTSRSGRATVAEAARMRVMQGPPWSGVAERRRILTDDPEAVNSVRGAALALALVALALAGTVRAAAADPPRPPRELRLLVVLAGFPDPPPAKSPAHFARPPSRSVAYWTEVSSGRLRLVPTLDELAVTLPGPRRSYVGRPDSLARDAVAPLAAAPAAAGPLVVVFPGAGRGPHP